MMTSSVGQRCNFRINSMYCTVRNKGSFIGQYKYNKNQDKKITSCRGSYFYYGGINYGHIFCDYRSELLILLQEQKQSISKNMDIVGR